MRITKHAKTRSQQRGISKAQVDLIVRHGQKQYRPGGTLEYRLLGKDKDRLISDLKKEIQIIERCSGVGVLMASDQETVITTYHKNYEG